MSGIMDKQGMVGLELISPTKQKEWTWPAVANFILGGERFEKLAGLPIL